MPNSKENAVHPLQVMDDWEIQLWKAHTGTWTSHYTVRNASGEILDEYDAVNEINMDMEKNIYSQRNTYTRKKVSPETGKEETSVETRGYSAYWDGKLMVISGRVLLGTAIASNDASRRVLTLNFHTTAAHPMGIGFETFELITLGEDGIHRARCMQHWKHGVLEKICSVFGEKCINKRPAIDPYGKPQSSAPEEKLLDTTKGDSGSFLVRNPRTGLCDYVCKATSATQLEQIAATCRANQRERWSTMTVEDRAKVLLEWSNILESHKAEIIASLMTDTGRILETRTEVMAVLGAIKRWCSSAPDLLKDSVTRPSAAIPFITVGKQMVPYQLVGIISPWNFPLLLSMIDSIPALLAGCAVIIKPSEVTPRFAEAINKTLAKVPTLSSVLAYVNGDGKVGEKLVGVVDSVCFTGSVATGRRVGAAASARMIPSFLELGGKDAAIVLEGCDIERAAAAILWGATVNAGASCLSIERVYVDASIHDQFVATLVRRANTLRLAFPTAHDGDIGPIIFDKQAKIIAAHIEDATNHGAKVLCGGSVKHLGGGLYVEPTVITGCNHTMQVMTEETFGPVIPVMVFPKHDIDGAVGLANDSVFGLSGAVFGSSEDATAVAKRMNCGAVSINDAALTALVHDGEKASFGLSGVGPLSRMGDRSIFRFLRPQAHLANALPNMDPWWYKENEGNDPTEMLRKLCKYVCGDFNNSEQAQKNLHPFCEHVTRVVNDRIKNLPIDEKGVFLLEETDILHLPISPGAERVKEIRPLLLRFELRGGDIWLESYKFAEDAYEGGPRPGVLNPKMADLLRNSNPDLGLDYSTLSISSTFKPEKYVYDPDADSFSMHSKLELPGGMSFTLAETLSSDGLMVMEKLEKDGQSLIQHTTPIEYRRI
jgi:aldehyde dehydrogenase (NAD+)